MSQLLIEDVVRDRASDKLFPVPASASVGDAVELMAEREIGAVLVMTEDGLVAGIFTERDLLMRVVQASLNPRTTPISLVMTRNVRFVSPGTTVEAAMALMHLQRHRHLLVIDGPKVHGLVSMRDLVYQTRARRPWSASRPRCAAPTVAPRHEDPAVPTRSMTMNTTPMPTRRTALIAGLGSLALFAGCSERGGFFALPGAAHVFHGLAMGSSYTVKIASRGLADTALAAAQSAVAAALADVVGLMSHYDPGVGGVTAEPAPDRRALRRLAHNIAGVRSGQGRAVRLGRRLRRGPRPGRRRMGLRSVGEAPSRALGGGAASLAATAA